MPDDTPANPPRSPSRATIAVNVLLQALLGLVIIIGINALSYRWYRLWDLSPSGTYTLSSSTKNFLDKLSKDVEITVVFGRGDRLFEDVHALTDEYRRHGKDRIKVQYIDPIRDRERTEQIKVENGLTLQQNGLLIKANKGTRFVKQEEMVVLSQGMDNDHPQLEFRGEDAVTSALVGLIEGGKRKFHLITGKGARAEAAQSDVLKALRDLGHQQNFDVSELNLGEITAIPSDTNGMIFVGAKYDLSEREAGMLRSYWNQKRAALLFLLDPDGSAKRLEQFLASMGVSPRNDRVLFAESTSTGPRKEYSVDASFSKESPVTRAVRDATATLSGQTQSLALEANETKLREQALQVLPLMTAAPRFWGETSYFDDLPVFGEGDVKPPVYIAASVERGAVQDERLRVDSARMVVVGNASILDRDSRLAVNQDFLAGSLNWMLNREKLIGITPKRKMQYRLQLTDNQRDLVFWITTLCTPAVVLMFGFSVWAKRRAT